MKNAAVVHEGLDLVMTALRRRREELEGTGTPDLSDLLWQVIQEWQEARPTDRFPICLVHELRATRHRWAHQYEFSTRDAYRAVDTVEQFLRRLEAPEAEEAEGLRLRIVQGLLRGPSPHLRGDRGSAKMGLPKRGVLQPEAPTEQESTIMTLGSPKQRTEFCYAGDIHKGVTLGHKDSAFVSPALFEAALQELSGQRIRGGFSMTDPPADGFGQWVVNRSKSITGQRVLTPRHGSFVAAILAHEANVESWLVGNAVWLKFPSR